jgi:ATP-dependent exoDNAse (exonuclease V) alpha subunit
MRLNGADREEADFARWQLEVGHGRHTDDEGTIRLPDHFKCGSNTIESLSQMIYPDINVRQEDAYFAERTILSSCNDDVDGLNQSILDHFPGEEMEFTSSDSVEETEGMLYPTEYLNSVTCSGMPLSKLKLKIGSPVIILRNLNPQEGVCNGTRAILTRITNRVLEVRQITGDHVGSLVFIPRMKLQPSDAQLPFKLTRCQFPVKLCFSMTINKAQGQSVTHVGLDLRSAVFTHGQLYVAISRVRSVHNIKAVWDAQFEQPTTKNLVFPEVLLTPP